MSSFAPSWSLWSLPLLLGLTWGVGLAPTRAGSDFVPEATKIGPSATRAAMQRLAAGTMHSHAIDSAGGLWSWGYK
jgi:hypothetical protein